MLFLVFVGAFAAGCDRSESPGVEEEQEDAVSEVREEAPEIEEYDVDVLDDSRSVERRIEDAALEARVRLALVDARPLRPFNFQAEVQNGRVILRGEVGSDEQRQQAVSVAGAVNGVREVVNEITAAGAPPIAAAETEATAPEPEKTEPEKPQPEKTEPEKTEPARPEPEPAAEPAKPKVAETQPSERPNFVIRGVWREPRKAAAPPAESEQEAEKEAPKEEGQVHTVSSGDNLWTISRRYGVTVDEIRRLNNLRSNSLRPGQKLRVK